MKLKGSIAVFAVAAAFAGQVAAQTTPAEDKFTQCTTAIGWASFLGSKTDPAMWTGAWAGVNQATKYFQNSNSVSCWIPKNKRESYFVGNMTAAQCGLYSKVASAGMKFAANKPMEAQSLLAGIFGGTNTSGDQTAKLVKEGKLDAPGQPLIDDAALAAYQCVTDWIDMGGNP